MLKLKLISENPDLFEDFEVIEEQSNRNSTSNLYVKGPFIGCNQVNKNKKCIFIFIQHGINYRFYFPMNFNKYYVLNKDDSDYLKRIGISQSKINIMGLLNVLDQRKPNTAHSNNIKLKKLKKRIVLVLSLIHI